MLANGRGVARDAARARELYVRGREMGEEVGCENVEILDREFGAPASR